MAKRKVQEGAEQIRKKRNFIPMK